MQRQIDILTSQVAALDDSDGSNPLHGGYFPFPIPMHKHGGDHSETSSVSSGMRSPHDDRSVASGRDHHKHSGLSGRDHRSFAGAASALRDRGHHHGVSGSHKKNMNIGGHSSDSMDIQSKGSSTSVRINGAPGDHSEHLELSALDSEMLVKQIVRLEQDLKDFKAKAKIDMAHLLEILNMDFMNRVVQGVELLLVDASRSSTYQVFSAVNNSNDRSSDRIGNSQQVLRREPSKLKIIVSTGSGLRLSLPEKDSSGAQASDSSRSPMTAMTDSLSLYEDELPDDASKAFTDDDNKSFISGSNYGISKIPLSTITEAASVPKKPAFSTTFPLVINQSKNLPQFILKPLPCSMNSYFSHYQKYRRVKLTTTLKLTHR